MLRPCTLCMVHAHDNISGNCVRLTLGEMEPKWVYLHHIFVMVQNNFVEQNGQTTLHSFILKDPET